MTIQEGPSGPAERTFLTAPSLACDLTWLLWIALKSSWRPDYPSATEFFDRRPDLVDRIRSFWADTGPGVCFTEAQVLADHAGALGETSPTALWAALESAVATAPTDLAFESESPEDRAVFMERLVRLKGSPALVRSYLDLLREVWEPVDEIWQSALPALQDAGRALVAQLEGGRSLGDLVGLACNAFQSSLPSINARVEAGQPLLVVPCLFFGQSLYLEFPGLTLVGAGLQRSDAASRALTESLARRLKAVADPTRLALLHYLAETPSTVGELALSFGLAQPTVSMHVKSLRGSGLVRSERAGGRIRLSADPTAVDTLLDEVRHVVAPGTGTAPALPDSPRPPAGPVPSGRR